MTDEAVPRPFDLMLRRPDDQHGVYLAPGFDDPEVYRAAGFERFAGGGDLRSYLRDTGYVGWSLSLPHSCDEWAIGAGDRGEVLAAARRFRAELDQAITALEAAAEPEPHIVVLSLRGLDMAHTTITHPDACQRLPYGRRCAFDDALYPGGRSVDLLPTHLGVYAAVVSGDVVEFAWVRGLTAEEAGRG